MQQICNSNIDQIMKCLEDYLQLKRLAFARFYFLSSDEMLDMLAQARSPRAVEPHLLKCFGNLHALDFVADPTHPLGDIAAVISSEVGFS